MVVRESKWDMSVRTWGGRWGIGSKRNLTLSSNIPFQNAVLAPGILNSDQQITKNIVMLLLWVTTNFLFFYFQQMQLTEKDRQGPGWKYGEWFRITPVSKGCKLGLGLSRKNRTLAQSMVLWPFSTLQRTTANFLRPNASLICSTGFSFGFILLTPRQNTGPLTYITWKGLMEFIRLTLGASWLSKFLNLCHLLTRAGLIFLAMKLGHWQRR